MQLSNIFGKPVASWLHLQTLQRESSIEPSPNSLLELYPLMLFCKYKYKLNHWISPFLLLSELYRAPIFRGKSVPSCQRQQYEQVSVSLVLIIKQQKMYFCFWLLWFSKYHTWRRKQIITLNQGLWLQRGSHSLYPHCKKPTVTVCKKNYRSNFYFNLTWLECFKAAPMVYC